MAISPDGALPYFVYDGYLVSLYPWMGQRVALLTSAKDLDGDVMQDILNRIDAAYDVYHAITGQAPAPYKSYNGLLTIAEVPTALQGAANAIGFLGAAGIEITTGVFDQLYAGAAEAGTFDQTVFYELGRNFWFYGPQLGEVDAFVTGFAIANRFVSMQEAGIPGSAFGALPFAEFKQSLLEDLAQTFFGEAGTTLANTLGAATGVPNANNWGAADLAASLLTQVYEDLGFDAYARFYQELAGRPAAGTPTEAFGNLVAAASQATGIDYGFLNKAEGVAYVVGGRGDDRLEADGSGNPVLGFGGDDTLVGTAGADRLFGDAGNDILRGGGGRDQLVGGAGDDTYFVDTPGDRVFEGRGQGTDRLVATSAYTLAAGQEIEILQLAKSTGGAPLSLTGNAFGQTLIGNAGDNRLAGGGGDDSLVGGLGADRLTGGAGADTFVFDTRPGRGNVDHVRDFASQDDVFHLDHGVFSGLETGALAPEQFKTLGPAKAIKADADDRILYKQKTGELFYDADGSGRKEAVLIAVLDNHAALDHTDFLIV
ncbi:hemolysin [Methylobacterium sp. Leaf123]|uniref:calcium-binding protein n=1 Tax=Methylobacterium sp. Leaf123 TaxID=1736264 RepID=UPI0006F58D3F|nr:calcium-binding protein [Methylobacterium sp. Leaf123]KQQ14138.1 hemolysin [Methylobacterium sp. Leaf123]